MKKQDKLIYIILLILILTIGIQIYLCVTSPKGKTEENYGCSPWSGCEDDGYDYGRENTCGSCNKRGSSAWTGLLGGCWCLKYKGENCVHNDQCTYNPTTGENSDTCTNNVCV